MRAARTTALVSLFTFGVITGLLITISGVENDHVWRAVGGLVLAIGSFKGLKLLG